MDISTKNLSERQIAQAEAERQIIDIHGPYDKGIESNGAHYIEDSPLANNGVTCESCIFFIPPNGCQIVEGDISSMALCKRWIVPDSRLYNIEPLDDFEDEEPEDEEPEDEMIPIIITMAKFFDPKGG